MENDEFVRYLILHSNIPGKKMTHMIIEEHVAFLKSLDAKEQLVLAGPYV
ncbi:MAG: hypothetical protein HeimC3_37710 [Candidatus Heimdallarchaeota archaeon LC_3]|nr:MAG: hypothetical protein HeimC3_50680 [Candidatus Heimdallarchaeota archaeon LC_3]OLS21022.1 MAG: hypothetical protein HeimC3_37710 [Candidatus Heimdallarchaeota archaeon LC_3]